MRDVLKSTTLVFGALCVMTIGTLQMPTLCVDSLITVEPQLQVSIPSLVLAVVQSTMTMWPALGMRHVWLTALIMVLEFMTVVTMKLQGWCVEPLYKVSIGLILITLILQF